MTGWKARVQYHIPAVLRLKGVLDTRALTDTLRTVIGRHEVLRTVIREHDEQGYQQIMATDNWKLSITWSFQTDQEGLSNYIAELISRPFDLSADYMLRAELIKLDQDDHILVVTMHHIASDGWSRSILVKEVVDLYEAYVTRAKSLSCLSVIAGPVRRLCDLAAKIYAGGNS